MSEAGTTSGAVVRRLQAPWLRAMEPALVACAYLLLFGDILAGLAEDWLRSGEYGHGLLLVPIAAFLAWRTRVERPAPARGAGLVLLAGAVLLFLLGSAAAEFFTRRVAALGALAALTVHYRGWRQLRAWWLPFGLLLFTIPLPEVVLNSLTLPLQLLASRLAVELLEFRHVPVELAGNIIFLPGRELFVAEACSGLRSISALLGLTLLIGGTSLSSPWARGALLLVALPAAIAANAFRVFATGYGVFFLGPWIAEGRVHEGAGAAVFLLGLGAVAGAALLFRRLER